MSVFGQQVVQFIHLNIAKALTVILINKTQDYTLSHMLFNPIRILNVTIFYSVTGRLIVFIWMGGFIMKIS